VKVPPTRHRATVADHALWDEVARSIRPLGRRTSNVLKAAPLLSRPVSHIGASPVASQEANHNPRKSHVPPPLASMDRRTAQKLSRGQVEPEARLDLHGEGLETARMHLLHFLQQQRQHGARFVLVITGKGASPFARHTLHGMSLFHTPEREGRLRREVPLWLHEEAFRHHAVGFQPAHPRHGGGGAFYVRLRKLQGPL
jgi:DNA-nicking Smr family endonuclease